MPIYRFEDLKDVQQNPGLSSGHGESIKGEKMYFCHRIWEAGTEAKPHYHACEQFIYIMRGRQKFPMGGEEYDLGPGDVIHIPANEVHAAEMIEEVEAIYVKDTTWSLKGVAAGEAAPDAPRWMIRSSKANRSGRDRSRPRTGTRACPCKIPAPFACARHSGECRNPENLFLSLYFSAIPGE